MYVLFRTKHISLSPTLRPAGGRSTWTATACDFISLYLTGAMAVMDIKVRMNVKKFNDKS